MLVDNYERVGHKHLSSGGIKTPLNSYSFLLRLSKKLGNIATSSFIEVRYFLSKDTMNHSRRYRSSAKLSGESSSGVSDGTMNVSEDRSQSSGSQNKADDNQEIDTASNLDEIVKQSHDVLAIAKTVFPVTLFPDTVFVDRTKVTIIRRNFFWSEDVMSIRIEDVLNVSASVGPLFGSLTIASRVMSTVDHFKINYFWRSDASHLKHVIQGYVIAQHNKLDTAHLEKEELIRTLEELGQDREIK